MRIPVFAAVIASALAMPAAVAFGQVEKSLHKCQKTAAKETQKYVQQYVKALSRCADQLSREVVQDGAPAGDAAKKCKSAFLKVVNSSKPDKTLAARLSGKIEKSCAPPPDGKAAHGEADIIGTSGSGEDLDAMNLDAWCAGFGGGDTVGDLADWISCLTVAGTCQAHVQLATAYPRILEWLAAVEPGIASLDPACGGSCDGPCADQDIIDACSVLSTLDLAIEGATDDDRPEVSCGQTCGNGLVDAGESCDGADLNGETCVSLGYAGSGLACTPTCELNASACGAPSVPSRFRDNGDQTATDLASGLMWEIKSTDVGSHHNTSNPYDWSTSGTDPDGALFLGFLDTLNNVCDDDESTPCTVDSDCTGAPDTHASNDLCGHGGHRDWRIPTVLELRGLLLEPASAGSCGATCVDPDFPGPTSPESHWTSTELSTDTTKAFGITFSNGFIGVGAKTGGNRVRAVRGGL